MVLAGGMQTKSMVSRFIICVCGHDTSDGDCYVTPAYELVMTPAVTWVCDNYGGP